MFPTGILPIFLSGRENERMRAFPVVKFGDLHSETRWSNSQNGVHLKHRFPDRPPTVGDNYQTSRRSYESSNRFDLWVSIMGHGPCTFKKRDVKTALQAVRESGVEVARIEIDKNGKIVIIAGRAVEGDSAAEPSEWD